MTRLAVLGAGGRTGHEIVAQALAAGHDVTAMARRPESVPQTHERLNVVQADILDPSTLTARVTGQDAVLSVIHTPRHTTTTLYSRGVLNVLEAMAQSGVKRLVCVTSQLIAVAPGTSLARKLFVQTFPQKILRNRLLDMERMENELAYSETDWTVVRAPKLVDGPHTGEYRTSLDFPLSRPRQLSRADLADYLLRVVDNDRAHCSRAFVSY
jgi:putative NADH-flavin reductase